MTNKNLTVIKNADLIISMDDFRRVLNNYDILISDGQIQKVEKNIRLYGLEKVIDAAGCLVTPGLVNTHHHLFQSLTKAVPGGQNALLFGWLKTLYPIWSLFGPEEMNFYNTRSFRTCFKRLHHEFGSSLLVSKWCDFG